MDELRDTTQLLVEEFNRVFGLTRNTSPTIPNERDCTLRLALVHEEVGELYVAILNKDLVAIADALADIDYVLKGFAITCGIDMAPVVQEVHRSNMTKVWPDGTIRRREDGKIIKPPTYSPAAIDKIIEEQQTRGT